MEKNCLFIDDNPTEIESYLENLNEIGPSKNLHIKCDLFGVEIDDDNDPSTSLDKIKTDLYDQYMENTKYDLVACDFNISDGRINGLDIVNIVRQKNRNCAIVIYSGDLETVANQIADVSTKKERRKKIKTIVNNKITAFIDRMDYVDEIINILKKQIRLELYIEKKLLEHGELELMHGYEQFRGLSLKQIAREINNDSVHGNKFKLEIIERGISHMIDLNLHD